MHKRFKFRRTTLIAVGLASFLGGLGIARTKIQLDVAWVGLSIILLLAEVFGPSS